MFSLTSSARLEGEGDRCRRGDTARSRTLSLGCVATGIPCRIGAGDRACGGETDRNKACGRAPFLVNRVVEGWDASVPRVPPDKAGRRGPGKLSSSKGPE